MTAATISDYNIKNYLQQKYFKATQYCFSFLQQYKNNVFQMYSYTYESSVANTYSTLFISFLLQLVKIRVCL